jgi:hypothetical protein
MATGWLERFVASGESLRPISDLLESRRAMISRIVPNCA